MAVKLILSQTHPQLVINSLEFMFLAKLDQLQLRQRY
jgi:hypothetical protein